MVNSMILTIKKNVINALIAHENEYIKKDKSGKYKFGYKKRSDLCALLQLEESLNSDSDTIDDKEGKLSALIDLSSGVFSTVLILQICQVLKIKPHMIFSSREHSTDEMKAHGFYKGEEEYPENYRPLDDPDYFHTYHCYSYPPNTTKDVIDHFLLTIRKNKETGEAEAEYELRDNSGYTHKYYGTPIIINPDAYHNAATVEIKLRNEHSKTITLSFIYHHYSKRNIMYFRVGTLTSPSTDELGCTLTRNCVISTKEITDLIHLQAMLKITNDSFTVSKDVMNEYCAKSHSLARYFFDKGDYALFSEENFYTILSRSVFSECDRWRDMMEIFLELKSKALEPTYLKIRRGPDKLAAFLFPEYTDTEDKNG